MGGTTILFPPQRKSLSSLGIIKKNLKEFFLLVIFLQLICYFYLFIMNCSNLIYWPPLGMKRLLIRVFENDLHYYSPRVGSSYEYFKFLNHWL